jgi:hypothetical protein
MGRDVQYMILSTPSSGSDWFARAVAKHAPEHVKYYDKEYFNPLCNWPHMNAMQGVFGCECVPHNLTHGLDVRRAETVLDNTWNRAPWSFDKEVWTWELSRVRFFADRFRCVVLTREESLTFPPSRARVLSWYKVVSDAYGLTEGASIMQAARRGHAVASAVLRHSAMMCSLPEISYRTLLEGSAQQIADAVGDWMPGLNVPAFCDEIIATRKPPHAACATASKNSAASLPAS